MSRNYNLTTQDAMFKRFYGDSGTSLVNPKAPLSSILMKNKRVDFVGSNFVQPVRFGSALGLGYRGEGQGLPEPVTAIRQSAIFPAKKAYSVVNYSRESIVASRNSEGAFAKATVAEAEACMEGFSLHNVERALFTSSTGKLGEITGAVAGAGTSASPWSFALASSPTNVDYSPKKQWFPQDAKIDLYTNAGVYQMTIQIVSATSASANNVSLTAITLQTGSSVAPAALDLLYWAGNKDQEIVGLPDAAPIAAGNLYGISQTTYPKMRGVLNSVSGSLQYDDNQNCRLLQ